MRKRSRRALLVAGGEDLVGERRFRRLVEEADCILAADGGYDALRSIGVEPQLVLGDFDSSALLKERADQEAARKRGLQLLSYPVKKDATDSQLALDLLLEEGYEAVLLLGGERVSGRSFPGQSFFAPSLCSPWTFHRNGERP